MIEIIFVIYINIQMAMIGKEVFTDHWSLWNVYGQDRLRPDAGCYFQHEVSKHVILRLLPAHKTKNVLCWQNSKLVDR